MTIENQTPRIEYIHNQPGTFSFNFKAFDKKYIKVYFKTETTRPLFEGDDYDITINEEYDGGFVTTLFTEQGTLIIQRELPYVQDADFVNNSAFDMEVLETTLDKTVGQIQQLKDITENDRLPVVYRGQWHTGYMYQAKDLVVGPDNNWYVCITTHLSDVFDTDLSNGVWELTLDMDSVVSAATEMAYKWANNPENVTVSGTEYSAYHWAKKAEEQTNTRENNKITNGKFWIHQIGDNITINANTGPVRTYDRWIAFNYSDVDWTISKDQGIKISRASNPSSGYFTLNQKYMGAPDIDTSLRLSFEAKSSIQGENLQFNIMISDGSLFFYGLTSTVQLTTTMTKYVISLDVPNVSLSSLSWPYTTQFQITPSNYTDTYINNIELTNQYPALQRSWEEEYNICQGYYQQSYGYNVAPGTITSNYTVIWRNMFDISRIWLLGAEVDFGQPMVVVPQVNLYSQATGNSGYVYNLSDDVDVLVGSVDIGPRGIHRILLDSGIDVDKNAAYQWTADADINLY